jgi:hypothetical protein
VIWAAIAISGEWDRDRCAAQGLERSAALQAIIDNVRANETLYSNIDVKWECTYRLERPTERTKDLLRTADERGRVALQGQLFFVDIKRDYEDNDGSRGKRSFREAFDGTTTRILRDDQVGNIIDGRQESMRLIRPHDLLKRRSATKVPLSTYLEGAEACRAHPLGRIYRTNYKDLRSTIEIVGEERIGDRMCVHLRDTWFLTQNGERKVNLDEDIWLAIDRNYIPVKRSNSSYADRSGNLLGQIDEVTGFREVEPGIWYPTEVITDCPDDVIAAVKKQRVLGWREVLKVVDVTINPTMDKEIFSDVKFSPSAVVYHVKNGEIVGTSRKKEGNVIPKEAAHITK